MSTASLPAPPQAAASDRLGLTLFLAGALHAIVILGLSFNPEDLFSPKDKTLTLEITLVHSRSDDAPDKADYLAQSNQKGGGTVEEKMRASSPFANPRPTDELGTEAQTRQATAPRPVPRQQAKLLTANESQTQTADRKPRPEVDPPPDSLNAMELVQRSLEIARVNAEIRQKQQVYAEMPRQKFLTANTKEAVYAAYQDAWRTKIERIGTLNYPDEAKRRNISGSLLLDVSLKADGSIHKIEIKRSSGSKVLDDGAIRIVKLAAPYAPFPPKVRQQYDIMHIIRTWQFQGDNELRTH